MLNNPSTAMSISLTLEILYICLSVILIASIWYNNYKHNTQENLKVGTYISLTIVLITLLSFSVFWDKLGLTNQEQGCITLAGWTGLIVTLTCFALVNCTHPHMKLWERINMLVTLSAIACLCITIFVCHEQYHTLSIKESQRIEHSIQSDDSQSITKADKIATEQLNKYYPGKLVSIGTIHTQEGRSNPIECLEVAYLDTNDTFHTGFADPDTSIMYQHREDVGKQDAKIDPATVKDVNAVKNYYYETDRTIQGMLINGYYITYHNKIETVPDIGIDTHGTNIGFKMVDYARPDTPYQPHLGYMVTMGLNAQQPDNNNVTMLFDAATQTLVQ